GAVPVPRKRAGPVTRGDTARLVRGRKVAGRVALVRADDNPAGQATAAAGAGARTVVVAAPRERRWPMMPAGRVPAPVVGLTGKDAKAALAAKAGAKVAFGPVK